MKEHFARVLGLDAENVDSNVNFYQLEQRFGGTAFEWAGVYYGITTEPGYSIIEAAWTQRIEAAVEASA